MQGKPTTAKLLTYLGIIPFLPALSTHIMSVDTLVLYNHAIQTYGAVIASFVAGIHWGLYLQQTIPFNLFIHSNIVAILAWFAVLIAVPISSIILALCFIYMWVLDKRLAKLQLIQAWYMRMRSVASCVVVASLTANYIVQLT